MIRKLFVAGCFSLSALEPCCSEQPDWDVFADLLVWHAAEVGMIPNSTLSVTLSDTLISKLNLNNMNFGWDLGFRTGAKYSHLGEDDWGVSLCYTWYRTEAKKRGSFPGFVGFPSGFPMTGVLTDTEFLQLDWLFAAKEYRARWNLLYNMFDFEADHQFYPTCALSFRPFLGLRGGWIDQHIEISSVYDNSGLAVPAIERLANRFWGVGPRCGLATQWLLWENCHHSFSLFGDLSGAFMWSHWSYPDDLKIGALTTGELYGKSHYAGSVMLQNFLGLEWDYKCYSLRVAYESQFWFDQLQIFNAYNGRQHNALTLQGGTVDFRFNF